MNPDRGTALAAALVGGWSLLWYLVIHPTTALAAVALALPASLCVRPAWRGVKLALGASGLLAIGYLAHGLTELLANPPERLAASISCGLAMVWLANATLALRARRARTPVDRSG